MDGSFARLSKAVVGFDCWPVTAVTAETVPSTQADLPLAVAAMDSRLWTWENQVRRNPRVLTRE